MTIIFLSSPSQYVTPLHFARLDLIVPSNSLRRLQNLHRMLGVGQISCTSNPSNGAYSSGTLKHFFNSDLHNSSASSERFSNSPVLSAGRGVTVEDSVPIKDYMGRWCNVIQTPNSPTPQENHSMPQLFSPEERDNLDKYNKFINEFSV